MEGHPGLCFYSAIPFRQRRTGNNIAGNSTRLCRSLLAEAATAALCAFAVATALEIANNTSVGE